MIEGRQVCVLIAAAGMSNRMRSAVNKTFLKIDGKPVLAHAIERFEQATEVDDVILIARAEEVQYVKREIVRMYGYRKVRAIVPGGDTRQRSIASGLRHVRDDIDIIMTHDGARPFIRLDTIRRALGEVLEKRACVVGVPVKDTIKSVADDGSSTVRWTPKRSLLWAAQSPQIFFAEDLRRAYAHSEREGIEATDDASLVEKIGISVSMVLGDYDNIKITTPEDMVLAELFSKYREVEGLH